MLSWMSKIKPLKFRTWETGHFKMPRFETPHSQTAIFKMVIIVASGHCNFCSTFGFVYFLWHRRCNRQDVSWYIPLQESQIATLRDHRTSIWLAFFSCAVLFTSQSISNSWIKLVILYSPVQFLTPSHNLSVSTERLGERNTWLYSSAVKICFWLHFCTFSHTTSCFKQCLLAT